jgi:hypothetical protein
MQTFFIAMSTVAAHAAVLDRCFMHFVLAVAFRKNSWRSMAKLPHHIWIRKHEMAPPSCPFVKSRKVPPLLGWKHTALLGVTGFGRAAMRPNPHSNALSLDILSCRITGLKGVV